MTSKNDLAWNKVFDELKLLDSIDSQGFVLISATTIKEVGGRTETHGEAGHARVPARDFQEKSSSILPTSNASMLSSGSA